MSRSDLDRYLVGSGSTFRTTKKKKLIDPVSERTIQERIKYQEGV